MRGRAILALPAAVMVCAAIVGCNDSKSDASKSKPGSADANPHYGARGAKVAFVSPKPGAALQGPVRVRVRVSGFRLDARDVGKPPKRGVGQLHFRMDGGKFDKPRYSGRAAALAARLGVDGRYSVTTTPTITYRGLPRGRHTIVATLANNDLSETGVRVRVSFKRR